MTAARRLASLALSIPLLCAVAAAESPEDKAASKKAYAAYRSAEEDARRSTDSGDWKKAADAWRAFTDAEWPETDDVATWREMARKSLLLADQRVLWAEDAATSGEACAALLLSLLGKVEAKNPVLARLVKDLKRLDKAYAALAGRRVQVVLEGGDPDVPTANKLASSRLVETLRKLGFDAVTEPAPDRLVASFEVREKGSLTTPGAAAMGISPMLSIAVDLVGEWVPASEPALVTGVRASATGLHLNRKTAIDRAAGDAGERFAYELVKRWFDTRE